MVSKEILWPYGGREVFVSFYFNGWTKPIPMIPVEGSSNFFHLIQDLPSGRHQYKFLVDGVWRDNDLQDFGEDEYGNIGNFILIEPQSMDIDNNPRNLPDKPSLPGGGKVELPLLDSDVDISRRRLSMHLANLTVYELIPNSAKVFVLDAGVAVRQAFHVMHEQGLSVVPIWDSNRRQISAMLTASDFILILIELHRNHAMLTDEQLDVLTISAWKEVKNQFNGEAVGAAQLSPLIRAGPDESLRDVAMRILQNKISTVPIIQESYPWVLHIACLGGILKYICRHFQNNLDYQPLLRQSVGSLSLGTWKSEVRGARDHLSALRSNESLGSALNKLLEARISSMPIVDGEGSLLNIYSRSDITSLAKDDAYTHIQLDQTVISQVQQLADGPKRYHTCTRSDPLCVVMERLSDPVVRRLIVIDAVSQQVEGIITLSDVF